jgi:hypothetical protein
VSDYDINNAIKTIEAGAYLDKIHTISDKKWQQLDRYSGPNQKTKAFSIPRLPRMGDGLNLPANQST